MQVYEAKDYGVLPNSPAAKPLAALFSKLQADESEKTLVLSEGTYYIDSAECDERMLYITNTVGDSEFSSDETPHKNRAALYLENVSNLTVLGNNAEFVIDGKVTNMVLQNCENVTVKDLEFSYVHPDMHELKVVNTAPFYADFELDCDTQYTVEKGRLWFFGKDYRSAADQDAHKAYWIGKIEEKTPDTVARVRSPFIGALRVKELGARTVRLYHIHASRFHMGERYYFFDNRRQYAGIFIDRCKNIRLEGIKQRFNYSLAMVAQDTENLYIDKVTFAPKAEDPRKLASVADFLQVCMCRGECKVTDSLFEGAGDDCINVHGVHFKIKSVQGNRLVVKFMHAQTHGYQPFHIGDEIAFINPMTLLEQGRTTVVSAALLNEYEIELQVENAERAKCGNVVEDVSASPEVYFANNTVNRIITRACLFTNRGKVLVENNHFKSNSMSGILLSDDAISWYESSMCCDVTVKNNVFDYCGGTPILIKPENLVHAGAVHKNIQILDNVFRSYSDVCISASSTDGLRISGNQYASDKILKTKNCENVEQNDA